MTDYVTITKKAKYRVGDCVWVRKFNLDLIAPMEIIPRYRWRCGMIMAKSWLPDLQQMGYRLDIDRKTFSEGTYYPEEVLYESPKED